MTLYRLGEINASLTSLRGVLIQAKWVKWESTLHAITSVLIFLNSLIRSENAKISVGHTNVLKLFKNIVQSYELCNLIGMTKYPTNVIWVVSFKAILTNLTDKRRIQRICRGNQIEIIA